MSPPAKVSDRTVDLLLLNPSIEIDHPQEMFYKYYEHQEEQLNLGLGVLAAYLRKKSVSFEIIDSNLDKLSVKDTVALVMQKDFYCLGFSLNIYNLGPAVRIIKELRGAGYKQHITAGGAFASLYAEFLFSKFPFFDSIVCGDGEAAICELTANLREKRDWRGSSGIIYPGADGQLIKNPHLCVTEELDALPRPVRYGGVAGMQPVELARGCYGSCSFCALPEFYRLSGNTSIRRRSLKSFFDEVEDLYKAGCRNFNFQADNFFPSCKPSVTEGYLAEFSAEIKKRELKINFFISSRVNDLTVKRLKILKSCGLSGLFIGVESINASDLEAFNKKISVKEICDAVNMLNSEEINFDCGYIFFSPWTTVSDLLRSANFMVKVGLEHFSYGAYRLKAHTYTKTLKEIESAGLIVKTSDFTGAGIETLYHQYRFKDPAVGLIWRQVDELYRNIYAFILENAIDLYKTNNNLMQAKIICDSAILRLIADLVKADRMNSKNLKFLAKERSALYFDSAKEAVLSDIRRFSAI